jgi:hypothetical protein
VVRFTPRPLYTQGKKPRYPSDRRLGGSQSLFGRGGEEKNSQALPGLEPPIIQPVAQRYTTDLRVLRTLFSCTYNLCSFFRVADHVPYPYKTTDKITGLCILIFSVLESVRDGIAFFEVVTSEERDSSVGIATGCGLDDRMIGIRFPTEAGNFSLRYRVQIGPGVHPASNPMSTGCSFPGGKGARA